MNLFPKTAIDLEPIVQELWSRFSEEEVEGILGIVRDVLEEGEGTVERGSEDVVVPERRRRRRRDGVEG